MSLSRGMFFSSEAAIDKQKKDWEKRLDTLLEKFNAVKPASENIKLVDEWYRLNSDAEKARQQISHYTLHSPETYISVTSTLSQLNNYVKKRQAAIQAAADKARGDRIFARIMLVTEEDRSELTATMNPA